MADMGTDMGNAGVNALSAAVAAMWKALLSLMNKIYETWKERSSAEYKLNKAKLDELKVDAAAKKAAEKIDGATGYIKYEELKKSKAPLTITDVHATPEQFKTICAYCKRNGIVVSALTDIRNKEIAGQTTYNCVLKTADLKRFAEIVDTMVDQQRIDALEAAKKEYLNKGENMTDRDRVMVAQLDKEIAAIRYGNSMILNEEQAKNAVEIAANGKAYSGVTMDEALDRFTGGAIDKDTACYIVDAKDPEKYLVASAKMAEYNGEQYIKTDYEVYNGDKQVYATNDGRFDGRPKDYWASEKGAMIDKGGFGDTVIKFYSKSEFDLYRKEFKRQNEAELDGLNAGVEGRNYENIEKTLTAKIDECGGRYDESRNAVVDKATGELMQLQPDMNNVDKARVAEAIVCGKQIQNYRDIANIEVQLATARANLLMQNAGSVEHANAQVALDEVKGQWNLAVETEKSLIDERKGVNFVQSKEIAQEQSAELSQTQELTHGEEAEKPDERREDRVDEVDKVKSSMTEWKGEIKEARASEGAKATDFADKQVAKDNPLEKAKKAFERD